MMAEKRNCVREDHEISIDPSRVRTDKAKERESWKEKNGRKFGIQIKRQTRV